jgi:WD40 repeat protein
MKLDRFLLSRVLKTLFAAGVALAILLTGVPAFPASPWMQGGHAARITGVACSPDGTMIASSSEDGTVKLWSTNGTLLRTLTAQSCPLTALAWSPDGTKIAVGTYYGGYYNYAAGMGLTWLWQAPSGSPSAWAGAGVSLVRTTTNLWGKVTALAFSADSLRLACGNETGSNIISLVANGSVVTNRPAFNTWVEPSAVTSVAFSAGGLMASGCEDSTVRVYNANNWNLLWTTTNVVYAQTSNVTAVAFSPDGTLLATASLDQTVKTWSTGDGSLQQTFTGHTDGVNSLAFSPDGQKIVSGCVDGTVKVWNVSGGSCLTTIAAHALPVTATVFSIDGSLVISGSDDHTIRLWSAADGSAVLTLGGHTDYINAAAISPDGTLCASAGNDSSIQIRRTIDGLLLQTLAGTTGLVSSIAFAPDSTVLASSGGPLDPAIKLWRLSDGTVLNTIAANTNGSMALAISPDGSILASGGDCSEQAIQLWKLSDGSLLGTLAGHSNGVTALAFSPHGDYLASSGRRFDHAIKIWSLTNFSLVQSFYGHSNNVESVAFSPDGNTVASGSSGTNSLIVWRISDGSSRKFGAGANPVFFVAFSPDGSTLASADQDTIKLWNVETGSLANTITQETFKASCFSYSPNGNVLLCGRADGTLVLATNALGALGQPPLVFDSITASPGSPVLLNAAVQPRTHYVIQSSANLANWSFLTIGMSDTSLLSIADAAPNGTPFRFYRALTPP